MADPAGRTEPSRGTGKDESRLKYAFDAGFLSGAHPSDSPVTIGSYSRESEVPLSSDPASCDTVRKTKRMGDLAASFRVFSESLERMELEELEFVKGREALRLDAEKRRVEVELEMTQTLLQTQLQIASFLSRKSTSRKRKRVEEDDSPTSARQGALMLSLLQCNFFF